MSNTKHHTTPEDWEKFDKMWKASKGDREKMHIIMDATGMKQDTENSYLQVYEYAEKEDFDGLVQWFNGRRKVPIKFVMHVLEAFGANARKEGQTIKLISNEESEQIEGQISTDEIMAGWVAEEEQKVAPERPDGHTFLPVPEKVYTKLLKIADLMEIGTDMIIGALIEQMYMSLRWTAAHHLNAGVLKNDEE